jgi:hypothetical protein
MKMDEWQPIETAPKDGRVFFVWATGYEWPETVKWQSLEEPDYPGYWRYADDLFADVAPEIDSENWTHWRDIFAPPPLIDESI